MAHYASGMLLEGIRSSLEAIEKGLKEAHESRERLIRGTRDVVILCSQAIIAVHGGDLEAAKSKAGKAQDLLESYRERTSGALSRYLAVPEQELVEALCLIALAEDRPVPGHKELKVSGESYILGLLDCIGELKRMTYDMIRRGRAEKAERTFSTMEEIYNMLYPFATYDKVLRDVRRKLDVNRSLLEGTRAAVTEEIRRSDLIRAMGK